MRSKYLISMIGTVVVASAFFSLGYVRGKHDDKLANIRFNLISSLHLYNVARQGSSEKLKSDLAFLVYSYTQEYTKSAGDSEASADFEDQLAEARRISGQVETNLVTLKP